MMLAQVGAVGGGAVDGGGVEAGGGAGGAVGLDAFRQIAQAALLKL